MILDFEELNFFLETQRNLFSVCFNDSINNIDNYLLNFYKHF
jgi:hypothetical protein